jgi:hypothetical protein
MLKRFLGIGGFVSVLLAAPSATSAQALVGRVVDAQTEEALRRVDILVLGEAGDTVGSVKAAADGIYQLRLRSAGTFRVLVSQSGYQTAIHESVVVPPGEIIDLEITTLTRLPADQGRAGPGRQ